VVCRAAIKQPRGRGQPRRFCGRPCRRAAEFELRRIGTRLANLETYLSNLRVYGGEILAKQQPGVEQELARLQARQLVLLGRVD
jgi:hypothetical protein